MADNARTMIIDSVLGQGHSASYGALLHTVSLLGPDPELLDPDSPAELGVWQGYFTGLRAALGCLAMYERQMEPESAARIVGEQIDHAMDVLGRRRSEGTGG